MKRQFKIPALFLAVLCLLSACAGGSADPITLLRRAGVDMASPQPVQEALAYFDQLIAEMEALL